MNVPFLDLSRQNTEIRERALAIFADIMERSSFIGGPYVKEFEESFAAFCQVPHAIAVNSGTDALRLAIQACGLEPGDEIITTPFTFIATSEAISQNQGVIRFADVHPDTCTLDPAALAAAISPRTRGLIPVHLYGNPCHMREIMAIADKHGLWVVEDACQAHGAAYDGSPVGSIGTAGTFSFYPTKNMGAFGEGGLVTTPREDILHKVLALRNHGQSARYSHDFEGFNARMDAVQAGVLHEKLKRLPDWNEQRRQMAVLYRQELAGIGDLEFFATTPGATHVYHLFTVRTRQRDQLREYLTGQGIGSAVHYPVPLHLQPAYRPLGYGPGDFPVAEEYARTVLSLPLYQGIREEEVRTVIHTIQAFFKH
ncbi:MAG: DegT/DnrJ/EryC1/StrS family aminotransferase [Acidobacteria bacterium]|nr:DegT/DnrJ/EryC1/StrS family aminotransferase [Acidobacteriota bacterium]